MHIVRRTWLPPTYVCCESFGTRSRMIQLSQQHKHAKHFSARWWPRLARASECQSETNIETTQEPGNLRIPCTGSAVRPIYYRLSTIHLSSIMMV